MTKTRDKLNEVKFFFKYMEEAQTWPNAWTQEGKDSFRYFFNAFVSAARSITYFIQVEFKHIEGFSKWYLDQQEKMKRDALMKFFFDQRNIIIHFQDHKVVGFFGLASHDIATRLKLADGPLSDTRQSETASSGDAADVAKALSNRKWIFKTYPKDIGLDNDVLSVSRQYLKKLEQIVDECEEHFLDTVVYN